MNRVIKSAPKFKATNKYSTEKKTLQVLHLVVAESISRSAAFKKYSGEEVTKGSERTAVDRCGFCCLKMEQCMSFIYKLDEDKQHCELLKLQAELLTEQNNESKAVVYQRGEYSV